MLMLSQRLLALPIVSIQTGGQLGKIASPIIDPRQLRILAFYCTGPAINFEPAILHSEDVREVSNMGLIIDSTDNIMPAEDLVRLKEVMDFKFQLEDKLVVEETGHKIGKVGSYSIEIGSFYIIKLNVRPGILGSLKTTERIIDRSQIIEITPEKIVIKLPTVKEKDEQLVVAAAAVENPFRRHEPQPDTVKIRQD